MLEILIGSSVLIVVLVLLRVILRGRISARVQYALWGLVALRLLVPVSLFSAPVSASDVAAPLERQIETYSSERAVTVEYPVSMGREPVTGETITAVARDTVEPLDVLRWVWYGGMVLTGAWFCYVNLRMAYRLRKDRKILSMDAPVPVYAAQGAVSPCLFGLVKPAIYLTEQAASDGEQARQIVAHELSHLRHGDCVWALVRGVCLVVWWFDPLVWLAAALSRCDCELACDETTVRSLGEALRYDYGRTLLGMATVKTGAATLLCAATTMTGGKSALAERIRSLAKPKNSVPLCIAALVLALIAAGCAFTGGAEEADAVTGAAYWNALGDFRGYTQWATVEIKPADYQPPEDALAMELPLLAGMLTDMGSWNMRYVDRAELPLDEAERSIHLKAADWNMEIWVCDSMDGVLMQTDQYTVFAETPLYTGAELVDMLAAWARNEAALYQPPLDA